MDDCIKLLGYHGTTREAAKEIIKLNRYKISCDDEDWLGKGVYFFQDDIKQAYYWCVKARKYKQWRILKSDIEAKKVINLDDTQTRERFEKIARKLQYRYMKRSDNKPRKLINSVVIEVMYRADPFDVIKKVYTIPNTHPVYRTNIAPMHIQLCVRNLNCIKTIEQVEYNGYKQVF